MPDDFVVFYVDRGIPTGVRFFSAEHPKYVRDCVRELRSTGVDPEDIYVIRGRRLRVRRRTLDDPTWPEGA